MFIKQFTVGFMKKQTKYFDKIILFYEKKKYEYIFNNNKKQKTIIFCDEYSNEYSENILDGNMNNGVFCIKKCITSFFKQKSLYKIYNTLELYVGFFILKDKIIIYINDNNLIEMFSVFINDNNNIQEKYLIILQIDSLF
jgi:hypothetical protein